MTKREKSGDYQRQHKMELYTLWEKDVVDLTRAHIQMEKDKTEFRLLKKKCTVRKVRFFSLLLMLMMAMFWPITSPPKPPHFDGNGEKKNRSE